MAFNETQPVSSLYVHVPFCAQKCHYCAFFSEASSGELINRYVAALVREMEFVAPSTKPKTVFFGGGTPSLLTMRHWEILFAAFERFGWLGAAEWTIECNPATVSLDKATLWREHGVNRVSMGVQSLDEALLDRLGRVHDRAQVFKSYDVFRRAGFERINLDLMFAIPGQTLDVWRSTLKEALAIGSDHLSSYEVIYEEDTALYDQLKAGEIDVNEDLACTMYDVLLEETAAHGMRQYEVANFARDDSKGADEFPTHACRHNVNYWRGGSFQGLGPSATGYVGGARTKNWANTQMYCELLEKGRRAHESCETLTPLARAGELAAFGLRASPGWPFALFQETTGFDLRDQWKAEMDTIVQNGWGRRTEDRFQLTREGLRFADAAAELMLR